MAEETTRFQAALAAAETDLRVWRRLHPDATLTEIEQRLDAGLRDARAALLAEVAADAADDAARCPDCGGRLVRRGTRARILRTQGDATVPLIRPYGWCPACEAGLFPPR